MDATLTGNPFEVRFSSSRLTCTAVERALGLSPLGAIYDALKAGNASAGCFSERALAALGVRVDVSDADVARIPRIGPLVVVANHPFGGVDGLALAAVLRRVRPDVKLLGNELLAAIPEMREILLPVDAFSGDRARNGRALREATRWLELGGCLGIFPAGEVSRYRLGARAVRDGAWNTAAARLAMMAGAPVVPVFFEGRNSTLFQVAGFVHPMVRTALLPRELLKRRGRPVSVHVGNSIPSHRLSDFSDAHAATDYLRLRTYVLGGRAEVRSKNICRNANNQHAVEPPGDADLISAEIAALPVQSKLVKSKEYDVFVAAAREIPHTLREIGRLRELTFRAVGEGTGRSTDLDPYDNHYRHLFVWQRERREVVGAYRLGLTDEILPRFGGEGLYTSTLFRYRGELLRQLTPGIELGRSFVRAEYQRAHQPLLLLWKGIGAFVATHPRYRMLFGPVSISNEYASLTRQILIAFLRCNAGLPSLAKLLSPRNPPAFGAGRASEAALAGTVVSSIDEVDELVAEIERDRRGVPVLLRQYMKLGAKLLGFNVDPDFGDVLDGLMLVDLAKVEPRVLGKYMGAENVRQFRRFHRID